MKLICKRSTLLLTGLTLCALLFSCSQTAASTVTTPSVTTERPVPTITTKHITTTAPQPNSYQPVQTWELLDPSVDWHYKTFLCPYDSTTFGGSFDPHLQWSC